MGNVVNTNNNSEPIPISSLNFQEIIKKEEDISANKNVDCEYTLKLGECDANGIQKVYPIVTKKPTENGKKCPSEYTQSCNNNRSTSFVSFTHKLNIPKQYERGSKLFIFNLNNPYPILLKNKSYISVELKSLSPINFQCISISIGGHIFPISSSIESNSKGIYNYNFFINCEVKMEPYSKIIFNLFFWNVKVKGISNDFYDLKINFNNEKKIKTI
jgi:hypothetical protein